MSSAIDVQSVLVVAALREEIDGAFPDGQPTLFTGVGKVNAAARLAAHLARLAAAQALPPLALNAGTAGSGRLARGSLVECTKFIQRDMDATDLGFRRGQTPFDAVESIEAAKLFPGLPSATCGTGDGFESKSHLQGAAPSGVGSAFDFGDVLDMEAYALAKVCLFFGVRFACLKYVTDGADGQASLDWAENLPKAAAAFRRAFASLASGA